MCPQLIVTTCDPIHEERTCICLRDAAVNRLWCIMLGTKSHPNGLGDSLTIRTGDDNVLNIYVH